MRQGLDTPHAPADGEILGRWVNPDVSYVNPQRRFCDFCGRPIARRYWETAGAGGVYCEPAHALLRATYPLRTDSDDQGDEH